MARPNWLTWALLAGGLYLLYKGATGTSTGIALVNTLSPGAWAVLGNAPEYIPYINSVESRYGIPHNLLARIAYQESSFDPSAVNASSGATGMFQLMSQWYPNAGQNWQADCVTAAQALAGYYKEFNDWQLAVAAYNWGPGNVSTWLNSDQPVTAMPSETQNYVTKVFTDVPVSGSLINA